MSYVLDTCVLLADPHALLRFDEHELVLPMIVVEELDRKKARVDEIGTNARAASVSWNTSGLRAWPGEGSEICRWRHHQD